MSEPMSASTLVADLRGALPGLSLEEAPASDMPTVYADRSQLIDLCDRLRTDPALQFSFLADVTAADFHPATPRFEVVYHLACLGPSFALEGHPPAPARRARVKEQVKSAPAVGSRWPAQSVDRALPALPDAQAIPASSMTIGWLRSRRTPRLPRNQVIGRHSLVCCKQRLDLRPQPGITAARSLQQVPARLGRHFPDLKIEFLDLLVRVSQAQCQAPRVRGAAMPAPRSSRVRRWMWKPRAPRRFRAR